MRIKVTNNNILFIKHNFFILCNIGRGNCYLPYGFSKSICSLWNGESGCAGDDAIIIKHAAVTTFSLASSRSWNTSDGERRTETEWFNIVAWGSLAEICNQFLTKGQQVYIEGRLQTRHWEDNDGVKHVSTEVVANEMIILGERRDNQAGEGEETHADDEFPF